MTHFNIAKVMTSILGTRRKRNSRTGYMLVDFRKAYDTVRRDQLFEMLLKRCAFEEEISILKLLLDMFYANKVHYDLGGKDGRIDVLRGVMQGGVISPFLFNVYLEESLK